MAPRRASSRTKSSGVVSFMFAGSPSNVATVNQLDGIGDRYRGNGRAGTACSLDCARNNRRRDEWPRGVVDQNDIGLLAGKRFKSGMHRGLARCAANCRRLVAQLADGIVEDSRVVGIQHRLHGEDLRMAAKWLHRPEDHGLTADRTILLRSPRTGTKPSSGCDKDGFS